MSSGRPPTSLVFGARVGSPPGCVDVAGIGVGVAGAQALALTTSAINKMLTQTGSRLRKSPPGQTLDVKVEKSAKTSQVTQPASKDGHTHDDEKDATDYRDHIQVTIQFTQPG